MAPTKFGLFKTRSRDQEQPSTENLLQCNSSELVASPSSPVPSTSHAHVGDLSPADVSGLSIDSEDEDVISVNAMIIRRESDTSQTEAEQMNYHPLRNPSIDATSTSTLQLDELEHLHLSAGLESTLALDTDDGASTSCDANSLQFDETSLTASEDMSVYCGTLKKPKNTRTTKEEQLLRDFEMWQASNVEVMEKLLKRSGTVDEQIKWEAIATARGLCTLTDNCSCGDCHRAKYLAGVADGDGGLGAAPLFSAISVGCALM